MKIQIKEKEREFTLTLPTRLLFSRFVISLIWKSSSHVSGLESIPKAAADRLLDELKRIKNKHGSWELMKVESADGEVVKIVL